MDRNKIFLRQFFKYSILVFAVVILYIVQTTPNMFSFFEVKPSFILPFCVVLTFLNYETPMLVVYITAGFLNEMAMSRLVGFHTLLLVILAVVGNIISTYYFNPNTRNTSIYSFLSLLSILSIDFFFVYILGGYKGIAEVYINKVLLTSLFSIPIIIISYYFISYISNKFQKYNAR